MTDSLEKVRVDKWLWAARFFKTRSLAAKAVAGGLVHVNGDRVKPARFVMATDELRIRRAQEEIVVIVCDVSERRGPASAACLLYRETAESEARRKQLREDRRLLGEAGYAPAVRPNKRDRRQIRSFTRKGE